MLSGQQVKAEYLLSLCFTRPPAFNILSLLLFVSFINMLYLSPHLLCLFILIYFRAPSYGNACFQTLSFQHPDNFTIFFFILALVLVHGAPMSYPIFYVILYPLLHLTGHRIDLQQSLMGIVLISSLRTVRLKYLFLFHFP